MARAAKERKDADLADRLIEAAEALYGRHGLDGVSLRQISAAAGTANNYAVQYHFGDGHGLINAILAKRLPEVESKRAAMLEAAQSQKRVTTRALVDVIYRPLLDLVDAKGERAYARFVLALLNAPGAERYAFENYHLMSTWEDVLALLSASHPDIPPSLLQERQRLLAFMVLTSVFDRRAPLDAPKCDAALIDNVLDMAAAALAAPVSAPLRTLMEKTKRKGGKI